MHVSAWQRQENGHECRAGVQVPAREKWQALQGYERGLVSQTGNFFGGDDMYLETRRTRQGVDEEAKQTESWGGIG